MVKASIIVVGDEIVEGIISDENSSYISSKLSSLGIVPSRITIIGDQREIMEEEIIRSLELSDIVIISGGLGPTPDDLTKEVVGRILRKHLLLDEVTLKKIEDHYARLKTPLPEEATKQALYPQGSILLENPVGICPGIIIKKKEKYLILLPGVPVELQKIFETGVLPFLETTFPIKPLFSFLIRTTGVTESEIMERITRPVCRKFKECAIRYLPSTLGVDIKITTEDKSLLEECQKEITNRLAPYVYGTGRGTLEERIGELLRQRNATLAIAESCTGGLIGDRITNAIGSSDYFRGGIIAYSNEIKKMALGVKEETLKKYGAVSKETVLEMAKGVRERFKAEFGISVSGIAGPSGGTAKKPVGLVFIGLATHSKLDYKEFRFPGNRRMVKEAAAQNALDMLRRHLEGYD